MATTATQTKLMELIMSDPISRFLANGGSWADAMEMEEEARLQRAVEAIPKWEAQLEAVLRKPQNPSALRHKARLLESLREAYVHARRPPSDADAFLAAAEAALKEEGAAKPKKQQSAPPKGAQTSRGVQAAKTKNTFAGLADSDSD